MSLVEGTQARYPELRACSFDRGFHSPDNRVRLDALLDVAALPKKGRLSNADRSREDDETFAAARRVHPAIESAINGLEHRGLDRVRNHGADGFTRAASLSVLATNLHRLGSLLQKRERKRHRRVQDWGEIRRRRAIRGQASRSIVEGQGVEPMPTHSLACANTENGARLSAGLGVADSDPPTGTASQSIDTAYAQT